MESSEIITALRHGAKAWTGWREANPGFAPDLSDFNLETCLSERQGIYDFPVYSGFDFSDCAMRRIKARNTQFSDCCFDRVDLPFSDLCFSHFMRCSFRSVGMEVTKIGSAQFIDCEFLNSDLSYCTAEETSFEGSSLDGCRLDHMSLVKVNFEGCRLRRLSVYGISAWELRLAGASQRSMLVPGELGTIEVDNIELAQFIHLLVRSQKLRDVIDTITSKVVLVLGRFTEDRKHVLERIRDRLGKEGFVSVLFDFEGPSSRDLTETVSTLAHLSRFVVADLTDPQSVPQELATVVPHLPSVPVYPIVAKGKKVYGMFEHFERYSWVRPLREYESQAVEEVIDQVITDSLARRETSGG